jgi:cellulose biosynthesis protein BcsQ
MLGAGDVREPVLKLIEDNLALLPGDLLLSAYEEELSAQWIAAMSGDERAFRVLSAFWRIMQSAAEEQASDVVLVDLGPNLGSINRAAMLAADFVVIPTTADLFAIQGLRNIGPALRKWRREWRERVQRKPEMDVQLPEGRMDPLGYVVLLYAVRLDRPAKAYLKWRRRISVAYQKDVLAKDVAEYPPTQTDPYELDLVNHYRSLMPMAREARKPIFHLAPADGAIGAHLHSVLDARTAFTQLARTIAGKAGLRRVAELSLT